MTVVNQAQIKDMTLGNLTKLLAAGSVYPQLNTLCPMWENVVKLPNPTKGEGREYEFMAKTALGFGAVQATGASDTAVFPRGQRSTLNKGLASYKDYDYTVIYDLTLQNKTGSTLISYATPFMDEMASKSAASGMVMSIDMQGDGSGAIGLVSSVTADATANTLTVVLSIVSAAQARSHIGWFLEGDKIKFAAAAGTAHGNINNSGTAVDHWIVVSADHSTDTVVLAPKTVAGVAIDITTATLGATDPTAADYMYRYGTTPNDLTTYDAAKASTDANVLSQVMVGLEAVGSNDGRKVNNLIMTGALGGSTKDCLTATLSSHLFNDAFGIANRRTGGFSNNKPLIYNTAWMHDSTRTALRDMAEGNRGFFNQINVETGVAQTGHREEECFVKFRASPYVQKARIRILPEVKGQKEGPLEFAGQAFEEQNKGADQMVPAGDGQHYKQNVKYFSGSATFVNKHSAAIISLTNFTTGS